MVAQASSEAARLRQQADRLREARDWRAAAEAYGALSRLLPDDVPTLLRQAQCLLGAGALADALDLYHAAAALRPRDAALARQIGHAALLLGRGAQAEAALAHAVALAPGDEEIWQAWLAALPCAAGPPPAAGVVLDLSDLATWIRKGRRAPSGIQRVQLEIASAALARPEPPVLCAMPAAGGGWRRWPAALFHRIDHLMRADADPVDPSWRDATALLADALEEKPLDFAQGAVLVPLGGSWEPADHLACLRQARARWGLRQVPLLHDCAPLVVPEHCTAATARGYARWFSSLALHADGLLTVSRATREEFRRWHAALLPELPIPAQAVVRLDATPRPPPAGAAVSGLPRALRHGRPYVLFVATLEGRKNHLMVFQAWLTLLRKLGPAAVPDLVCVGRPGWRAEAALELLENAAELRGRVHLLRNIGDPLLAALYRGCLFTLYNSHHEGWGLPVTESLAAGRPVLAPAHSALLEAGRDGAIFFESGSEPDLVAKLEALITDPAARAAAEAAIAAAPPRPGWDAVAGEVLGEAARLAREAAPLPPLPIRAGERLPVRLLETGRPEAAMAVAEAARAGQAWHPLEEWGVWTRPGSALLRLPLPPALHGPLRLELELRAPARDQVVALRCRRGEAAFGAVTEMVLPAGGQQAAALEVPAGEGAVEVVLESASTATLPDGRRIGVGLLALSVARADSVADRLAVLEARHFRIPRPVRA
ncbi:glycosyltransferase family 4 protein [Roseomonas marmotae]|uniref:Glycosyltransferase n=1 Tax=Roseomonas marmotae TaxID=2768161 RepID=A0ABS3KBV5_9PROT|nr:glycosyltransferase family 1 protein [Roseomonas marmotae]MBO1074950.1 glycosyltransferase [Roseomonas marmotae]QTI80008.1 glycosyltransferase [Roseomonas marmotae]